MLPELAATRFWLWFATNEQRFRDLSGPDKERLLDELLEHLHEYCSGLFFQAGGAPDGPRELIITAEGDREYFSAVSDLVDCAPTLEGWCFVAFMPPAGFRFVTRYEDVTVDPAKAWFMPLTNDEGFGLHIALPDYSSKNEARFLFATRIVLQTGLGELVAAREIQFFDVGLLPVAPEEQGYIELRKLDRYLASRRTGVASGKA